MDLAIAEKLSHVNS